MKPVKHPIHDILDLHTFRPQDVSDLLNDYFAACRQADIFSVRVIHGKGKGILRMRVLEIIDRHPLVASYQTAPQAAGGWGATLVQLKRRQQ